MATNVVAVEECEVAPEPDDKPRNEAELAAARAKIEGAKKVSKEAFELGLRRLLNLAIAGYPRALRSTQSIRNELLRRHIGNQDAAVDDVKAQAADLKEEGKTWLLGVIPYVGLPASVLYPTWRALRRCCLLAGTYGLPLYEDWARAKVLHVFCGMRAVPIGECALEKAVQMTWTMVAGPAAAFVPVGMLASKVANVEGHVMGVIGHETFTECRTVVGPEEYILELDAEPTREDYMALAKDTSAYALLLGREQAVRCWDIANDKERREATAAMMASGALQAAVFAADTAMVMGKGAVAAAPHVAKAAPGAAATAAQTVQEGVNRGLVMASSFFGGGGAKPQKRESL
eukprot:TRINITY_DN58867_c0_g1_i1.p1 TRINITY_DN58867_c0_g1~~TRINITY_DN58867_c0_g1_i1.p1  ORF type:complete len:372 (-),score=78.82 TRINITY_DN58867_c0_g1_i1:60-1097(-)